MPTFTVRLTPLEDKILHHIAADPKVWMTNLIEWRVRIAQDEYIATAKNIMINDPNITHMPATRDEIIMAADLPPKDPNWQPYLPDLPETVEYDLELEEDDLKMLAWMYENPHTHILEFILERANQGIKELAEQETKRRIEDPNHTDPIPLDPIEVLKDMEIKPAVQIMYESTVKMNRMMAKTANITDPSFHEFSINGMTLAELEAKFGPVPEDDDPMPGAPGFAPGGPPRPPGF